MIIAGVDYGAGESGTRLTIVDMTSQTVIDTTQIAGLNLMDCGQVIADACRKHKVHKVCVNTVGFGSGLLEALRQQGISVVSVNPSHHLP